MGARELLAVAVTGYGLFGAGSSLLQARQIVRQRESGNISLAFLASLTGGYLLWLVYGMAVRDIPLIVVDSVGLICGVTTCVLAARFRTSSLGSRRNGARERIVAAMLRMPLLTTATVRSLVCPRARAQLTLRA